MPSATAATAARWTCPRPSALGRWCARAREAGGGQLAQLAQVPKISRDGEWRTIVGVVSNIMQSEPTRQRFAPAVYLPFAQAPERGAWFFARIEAPSDAIGAAVRTAAQSFHPDLGTNYRISRRLGTAFDSFATAWIWSMPSLANTQPWPRRSGYCALARRRRPLRRGRLLCRAAHQGDRRPHGRRCHAERHSASCTAAGTDPRSRRARRRPRRFLRGQSRAQGPVGRHLTV